jgi:hypothetical protein
VFALLLKAGWPSFSIPLNHPPATAEVTQVTENRFSANHLTNNVNFRR